MHYTKTLIPYWWGGEIHIEIDSNRWLPWIDIIWLPDNAIKESKERLRSAFRHCDIEIPPLRFVINLSPSDSKKSWTISDLALATGLLTHIAKQYISDDRRAILDNSLLFGEVWLDGSIKTTQGIFAWVLAGIKMGYTSFVIPKECQEQCAYFENITIYAIDHFSEMIQFCMGKSDLYKSMQKTFSQNSFCKTNLPNTTTFDDIQWHRVAKRALAIAVAWMHNVLLVGSPWWWKSMLAKATRTLLPAMSFDELVEVTYLYSLAGLLTLEQPLVINRPFRSIHSSSSKASIIWWGSNAQPWEVSLAHKWVLFLDEMGEFPRDLLDSLRQPLEDKQVHISRVRWKATYPAECMFIGATNPCICGYFGDPYHTCRCPLPTIKRYQSKISGPLLDRMDILLQIENQEDKLYTKSLGWSPQANHAIDESEATIKAHIQEALERQSVRYKDSIYKTNAQVAVKDLWQYIPLSDRCEVLLQTALKTLHYSLRVIHKTIRVARSIADYDGSETIQEKHIAEALGYRAQNWITKE